MTGCRVVHRRAEYSFKDRGRGAQVPRSTSCAGPAHEPSRRDLADEALLEGIRASTPDHAPPMAPHGSGASRATTGTAPGDGAWPDEWPERAWWACTGAGGGVGAAATWRSRRT